MSDRLAELRRQRALVQQHLEWLDREIAAADGGAASTGTTLSTPAATAALSPPAAPLKPAVETPAQTDEVSEQILQEYRVPSESLQQDVRKGCLLYFVAGLTLFALGIVVLYFLVQRE
jgi:hypothetical protein